MHQPRYVVDDLPPRKFAGLQSFLSTLPILDINIGSVPLKDVARFVRQWIGANKEPSVRPVATANSRIRVDRRPRSQRRLPLLDKFLAVVRMNRFCPAPALCLLRSHASVVEPYLIDEVAVAVGTSGPCCRGDRIDDSIWLLSGDWKPHTRIIGPPAFLIKQEFLKIRD